MEQMAFEETGLCRHACHEASRHYGRPECGPRARIGKSVWLTWGRIWLLWRERQYHNPPKSENGGVDGMDRWPSDLGNWVLGFANDSSVYRVGSRHFCLPASNRLFDVRASQIHR